MTRINKLMTLGEFMELLDVIKSIHGSDIEVGDVYAYEDYPTTINSRVPEVITNPLDDSKYLVIFD